MGVITNMGYLFGWAKRRSWDCVAHCESPATRDVALSPCVIMPNNIPRLDDDDDVSAFQNKTEIPIGKRNDNRVSYGRYV
ncbi:hypothetical protein OUZ56_021241 [Daphnia magna]|uniref:Uncharacterized protein n=1 Tax=Daphnia magna TaxID=35525 RepID=A0ABQ9ZGT3_9CRUS|nr:hypothetical protein OUZ56_021241 [Daphnia magna]